MPSDFGCDYCVRPGLSKRTPKADEDGQTFSQVHIQELYNERRYQHYLDDFNDDLDLARHLNERTNHFAETGSEDEKTAIKTFGFAANAATLAWWKRARHRDSAAAEVAQKPEFLPTPRQIDEWAKPPPAARFARLKQQIRETFNGRHEVPALTAEDNAQQLPPERELSAEQQQSLLAERDRQLEILQPMLDDQEPEE